MKRSAKTSADEELESPLKKGKTTESDERSFLKYYNSLTASDSIRFFHKKGIDMYAAYDNSAQIVADVYFKTSKVIKPWKDGKGPPFVDIKTNQFAIICKSLILEKKMEIEIHSNEEGGWTKVKQASPGNISQIEDLLFTEEEEMQDSQVMIAVVNSSSGGQRTLGIAFVDMVLKTIGTLQLADNDQLTNLESVFYQVGAKECYVLPLDTKDKDSKKIYEILEKLDIKATEKKKSDFKIGDIEQDLQRLLGAKKYLNSVFELDDKLAMSATSCIISGLELLANEENHGTFNLKHYDLNQYMRLDAAAIQALNILPSPKEPNQKQNIFGLLNKCKTPMGSRLLMQWLKQPLKDITQLQERLDLVDIFYTDQNMCKELRQHCFKRIPDLERVTKKIQMHKAGLADCVTIYQFVQRIPLFIQKFDGCIVDQKDLLENEFTSKFQTLKTEFKSFEQLVEETIDIEAIDKNEYLVSAQFDELLQQYKLGKDQVLKEIEKHYDDSKVVLGSASPGKGKGEASSLKLESDKSGYYFKFARKDLTVLENKQNKGKYEVVHNSGKFVKFVDAKLKKLSQQYVELCQKYDAQSKDLMKEIMNITASYMPVLEAAHALVARLDVFCSLAHVSFSAPYPYIKPTLFPLGEGDLELVNVRHPVLEIQPDMNYIPNSISMKRGESTFHIITGPNMGGKSTFIRSIAVICLMAQIGCFVPCEIANIPIRDAILARVGASDSQLRGLSTFMAEMLETSTILSTATDKSLIIIDELGRGTSTYDGFGLAWAISEHICNVINPFCLFATHFHELTQLADQISYVKNFHVSAKPDEMGKGLILLYEVKSGPSDQSFGIHVARLANFPKDVIEIAETKAKELENFEANSLRLEGKEESLDEKEGKEIIRTVLEDFAAQDLSSMSNEQLAEYLNGLKEQIASIENAYLSNILANVQ